MRYVVDRFEGKEAVLEGDDRVTILVLRDELPVEVKEGDVLVQEGKCYTIDGLETIERRERMKKRMRELYEE